MIRQLRDGFDQNIWWSRLLFCLILLITGLAYPLSNHLASLGSHAIILKFPADDLIPFLEIFVIPYYYWYLQIFLTLFYLILSRRSGHNLHRLVINLAVSDLIAAIVFLAMPTQMLRPEITGDSLLHWLVRLIYTIDLPYNLFPSKHVVWAIILNRTWVAAGPRHLWFRVLNLAGTALIIASTVLIKQHYIPDILGGVAVAVLSLFAGRLIWQRVSRRMSPAAMEIIKSD